MWSLQAPVPVVTPIRSMFRPILCSWHELGLSGMKGVAGISGSQKSTFDLRPQHELK